MSKPTQLYKALEYYFNFTILSRSIKRQGLIQTIKSSLWVAFHTQLEGILYSINKYVRIYTELPNDHYIEIDEAIYFARTGTLWTRKFGFFHPIINFQPHAVGKFLFQTSWIKVILIFAFGDLIEYDQVHIGNHVHGPVYGHFVQHVLASHLALQSEAGISTTMVTHPSQIRFIDSYNNSISSSPIKYVSVKQTLCKLRNIAIYPVMDINNQKSYLDTIKWREEIADAPDVTGHIILRSSSFERRLHNRQQVVDLLNSYGIQILRPEKHRMLENISKLRNSNIIIGPEGSGLIDCFFIEAPQVIMFVGLVHDKVFEEVVSLSGGICYNISCPQRHTDFIINLQKLEKSLEQLGLEKNHDIIDAK